MDPARQRLDAYAAKVAAELSRAGIAKDSIVLSREDWKEERTGLLGLARKKVLVRSSSALTPGWRLVSDFYENREIYGSDWSGPREKRGPITHDITTRDEIWLSPTGELLAYYITHELVFQGFRHVEYLSSEHTSGSRAQDWHLQMYDHWRNLHTRKLTARDRVKETIFHKGRQRYPHPYQGVSTALTNLRKKAGTHGPSPSGTVAPPATVPTVPVHPPPSAAHLTTTAAGQPSTEQRAPGGPPRSLTARSWFAPAMAVGGVILVMAAVIGVAGSSNHGADAAFAIAAVKGQPTRWNPCAGPIGVQANYGRLLPAYRQRAQNAVQMGIAAVNDASGLELVYRGTTNARPAYASGANRRTADNAITIGFLPAGTGLLIGARERDAAAITSTRAGTKQWRAITAAGIQIRSKAGNYTQEVLWGLARASGLRDVPASQGPGIMAGNPEGNEYGPGDRAGLNAVGAGQGCIE